MKREELKRMLAQVDEQYIAEILDAEELNMSVKPVSRRSFARWTAAAAVICIAGGGLLLWQNGGSVFQPQDAVESAVSAADYFTRDVSEITTHRREYPMDIVTGTPYWAGGGGIITNNPASLRRLCDLAGMEGSELSIFTDASDAAVHAQAVLTDDAQHYADILLSDTGDMISVFPTDGGRERGGIPFYGFTDAQDADYRELYFVTGGVSCSILSKGLTDGQVIALADAIIEGQITPDSLLEAMDNAGSTPDDTVYFQCECAPVPEYAPPEDAVMQTLTAFTLPFPPLYAGEESVAVYRDPADAAPLSAVIRSDGVHVVIAKPDVLFPDGVPCTDTGTARHGVTLHGWRHDAMLELSFVKAGWGYHICAPAQDYHEAWMMVIADGLLLHECTPETLGADIG